MKCLSIALFCLVASFSSARDIDTVYRAIAFVESSYNPSAVNGDAAGILQIRPILLIDVNRIYGTNYTFDDRFDVTKSKEIFYLYLLHYLGETATPEEIARTWNGGPKGIHKESTLVYWQKVKNRMKFLSGNSVNR